MIGSSPTMPARPQGDSPALDAVARRLLAEQRLSLDYPLSDDGDSFATLACRDERGERVVLKYVLPRASRDACRRLRNEAVLIQRVTTEWPLRVLRHRASGTGYLVTDFDRGRLLRPAGMDDERVVRAVAASLARFQEACRRAALADIEEREPAALYYVKVLAKHLLHLWPSALGTWECVRAAAIVIAALPWMVKRSAPSHGDFMPTNLLYHDDDGSVTFTDLESFTGGNHPLFDPLALCTMDDRDLADWSWQPVFLRSYLAHAAAAGRVHPPARELERAYRGLLTFFLVYRLNEARINQAGGHYFDGLSKAAFVRRRLKALARRRGVDSAAAWTPSLEARRRNLRRMLPAAGFRAHLRSLRVFGIPHTT